MSITKFYFLLVKSIILHIGILTIPWLISWGKKRLMSLFTSASV